MKFSVNTKVSQVTSLVNVKAGIAEIQEYFQKQAQAGKKVSALSVKRLHRLQRLQELINGKTEQYWTPKGYVKFDYAKYL